MLAVAATAVAIGLAASASLLGVEATQRHGIEFAETIRGWLMGVHTDRDVLVRSADGVALASTVMRPLRSVLHDWAGGTGAARRLPTVLIRTPYGRASQGRGWARMGFAVVAQDMRGRGGSSGRFEPYANDSKDTWATLDWIVAQPWSNGRVATVGCSAAGESQLIAAATPHPAHRALIAEGAGGAIGAAGARHAYFAVYEGGIFQLASALGWFARHGNRESPADPVHAPGHAVQPAAALTTSQALQTVPVFGMARRAGAADTDFDLFRSLPFGDPQWRALGFLDDDSRPSLPALHVNGWYDQGVSDTLFAARWMKADGAVQYQPVVIGPGRHCEDPGARTRQMGDLPIRNADQAFGSGAGGLYARWLAAWLNADGAEAQRLAAALPAYQYYMLGEDRWLSASSWPPAEAQPLRWYLSSQGGANSSAGDGMLLSQPPPPGPDPAHAVTDRFVADPGSPVPTRGGAFCCTGDPAAREGPVDQSEVESRRDVLVYTSEPLRHALRIAGPLSLELEVSTSGHDGDLVAKLVDVSPDGRALNIQSGALRLSYRHLFGRTDLGQGGQTARSTSPRGMATPEPVTPNERMRVRIPMRDIAWRVEAGHRLRVSIAGSDFPRLELNRQTGVHDPRETRHVVAEHRLHHGTTLAFLDLHVLPTELAGVPSSSAPRP